MVKPFLFAIILIGLIAGGLFVRQKYFHRPSTSRLENTATEGTGSAEAAQVALQVSSSLAPSSSSSPVGVDQGQKQLDALSQSVADLKKRVTKLEQTSKKVVATPTATAQSSSARTVYIPLGNGGSTISTDWSTIATLGAQINTGSYQGYKDMNLEVTLQAYQGNGGAFARLYNIDDGTAVLNSEATSTSQDFTLVSSGSFRLPEGEKNYRIQLKSLTGYTTTIQDARIKVNF